PQDFLIREPLPLGTGSPTFLDNSLMASFWLSTVFSKSLTFFVKSRLMDFRLLRSQAEASLSLTCLPNSEENCSLLHSFTFDSTSLVTLSITSSDTASSMLTPMG